MEWRKFQVSSDIWPESAPVKAENGFWANVLMIGTWNKQVHYWMLGWIINPILIVITISASIDLLNIIVCDICLTFVIFGYLFWKCFILIWCYLALISFQLAIARCQEFKSPNQSSSLKLIHFPPRGLHNIPNLAFSTLQKKLKTPENIKVGV